jgi:4-hydroxybenzoate polyprenyltransferase
VIELARPAEYGAAGDGRAATAASLHWTPWVRLVRHFPFVGFLMPLAAVYAALIGSGRMTSPHVFALAVPIPLILAAGYAYNNASDFRDPAAKGNPVAQGDVSRSSALWLAGGLAAAAVVLTLVLYARPAAQWLGGLHVALVAAYSGAGVRLKESVAGPLVASIGLYAAGPAMVALEYGVLDGPLGLMLAAVALLFTGREIAHTLADAEWDARSGYRTFAIRVGSVRARRAELAVAAAGTVVLLVAAIWLGVATWVQMAMAGLLVVAVGTLRVAPARTRYGLVKLALVALCLGLLGVGPLPGLLLLGLFVAAR